MKWEKPSFVEINMNAEIGGYQEDEFEKREPVFTDNSELPKLQFTMDGDTPVSKSVSQAPRTLRPELLGLLPPY